MIGPIPFEAPPTVTDGCAEPAPQLRRVFLHAATRGIGVSWMARVS